jgi:hypothetical protein
VVNSESEVTAGRSAAFVGKLLLRSLTLALIGMTTGLMSGALNGAWSGALMGAILSFSDNSGISGAVDFIVMSMLFGLLIAICIGIGSGALIFFIASCIAWQIQLDRSNSDFLFSAGIKGATTGTLIGAVIMLVNHWLFSWFFKGIADDRYLPTLYMASVILGFIPGLFYATIRATLQEVHRQREEIMKAQ